MAKLLGVDVGGTFTDLFYLNEATGAVQIAKSSTTPGNLSEGLLTGLASMGAHASDIDHLIHGTTIATNALIERKGSRCGLLTTAGFRDVLEMGRRDRPHLYGMYGTQDPLVPRDARFEVRERMDHLGNVVLALDESDVVAAIAELEAMEVQAVAVCLLHSYANPEHERRIKQIILHRHPDWLVNLSCDLLPEMYEFERTSTTVIHTYLQAMVSNYTGTLKQRLQRNGYTRDVLFVQSNGGIMSSAAARERPANLVLSGPAAGVTAAMVIAKLAGFSNVISGDMGGTSFDVCLIPGSARTTEQKDIGFRQPLRVSMLDVHAIGAGGGSIARIDARGLLQIGPDSAGSAPGPAAYGRGGQEPTVTDAQVVLGRIGTEAPLGGSQRLDRGASAHAIATRIATPLGLSVEQAAQAIVQVANNNMAGRIRLISIERGHDPRDFVLVAFGGAGPLHAVGLMKDVGIGRCLVPAYPGVLCAMGCVVADVRHDFVRTVMQSLQDVDMAGLRMQLEAMKGEGTRMLRRDDIPLERVDVVVSADMSYEGQRNTIRVPLPLELTAHNIAPAFEETYRREYKQTLSGLPILINAIRVNVIGVRPQLNIKAWAKTSGSLKAARSGSRQVYFDDRFHDTPLYRRSQIPVGAEIIGPAIVEQEDCTTVLEPGSRGKVDAFGNILVEEIVR